MRRKLHPEHKKPMLWNYLSIFNGANTKVIATRLYSDSHVNHSYLNDVQIKRL